MIGSAETAFGYTSMHRLVLDARREDHFDRLAVGEVNPPVPVPLLGRVGSCAFAFASNSASARLAMSSKFMRPPYEINE